MFLYLITNNINGKRYVGITATSIEDRFRRHCKEAGKKKEKKHLLHKAILKYGKENFSVTVLAQSESWEELQTMEREAIVQYNTFSRNGQGYNQTLGGEGALGRKISEDTRRRMSENRKGIPCPEHVRQAVSKRHKGVSVPPEVRAKMREAQLGEKNHMFGKTISEETRQKRSASLKKHTVSKETRRKIGQAHKGKVISEDAKQTLREKAKARYAKGRHPWIGRKHSPETLEKLSQATKKYLESHPNPMQGKRLSEETRKKISDRAQGRKAWNKGVPATQETREKVSHAQKARYETSTHPWVGRKHSAESIQKMSAAKKGHISHSRKPVIIDGVQYDSIWEAAQKSRYTHGQIKYRLKKGLL